MKCNAPLIVLLSILVAACSQPAPQALGTLEWDRVTLPATASEPITNISVHEGQAVKAGEALLQLDPARAQARLQAAQAESERLAQNLAALRAGARVENRAEAQARLEAKQAVARNANQQLQRTRLLVQKQLLPRAQLDQALSTAQSAQSDVEAASAASALLTNGNRAEDIAQAEAALRAAQAQANSAAIDLARLQVRAPRAGHIDSLPYKVGDQPVVGSPLVVMLVGDAPYARIYVPEPMRAGLKISMLVNVHVDGADRAYAGHVRSVRSEPSFTPYYALNGKDAARLSYLAEIALGSDAAALPAGLPLRAEWDTQATQ